MDPQLTTAFDEFRTIRTVCTGIMGYLAMLQQGDFKGGEQVIVADLHQAAVNVAHRLDTLRDSAASLHHGASPSIREAVAVVLATEPEIRLPIQLLAKRLGSTVPGLPTSYWAEDLRLSQQVVRGVAKMNEALKVIQTATHGDQPATSGV